MRNQKDLFALGWVGLCWLGLVSCATATKTTEVPKTTTASASTSAETTPLKKEDIAVKNPNEAASVEALAQAAKEKENEDVGLSEEASKALENIISKAEEDVEKKKEEPATAASDDPELFPTEINESVKKWIQYFSVTDKERFQRFLDRGERYREVVQTILKENDVPPELYYLAMIESGYSTHAKSHAKAVGVWQFIKGTGKRYELEVSHYVDERRDPIRATEAAAKYLTDLYNAFQSWHLAMAAYNAGEFRILNAIIRGKSRDYWTLVRKKVIPRETRDYVPKFLAAVIIGRHPDKYGFTINTDNDFPSVEAVSVPSPIRLFDLAQQSDIPLETLKTTNPHLLRGITSPSHASYEVWVPKDRAKKVASLIPILNGTKVRGLKVAQASAPSDEEVRSVYRVRRGDTLASIARRHHVSVSYLKRMNDLAKSHIFVGQSLRVAAKGYSRAPSIRAVASNQSVKLSQSSPKRGAKYVVKRGDSLAKIADTYGISLKKIKKLNRLTSGRIYVGQKLKLF